MKCLRLAIQNKEQVDVIRQVLIHRPAVHHLANDHHRHDCDGFLGAIIRPVDSWRN